MRRPSATAITTSGVLNLNAQAVAIVVTNPDALKLADTLDARFAQSGPVGPLHCVPLIVKDNYETTDMSTSAGSLSLKGVMSKTDAFQIKKLREAGAIMLAKSNMAEFAFDPMEPGPLSRG